MTLTKERIQTRPNPVILAIDRQITNIRRAQQEHRPLQGHGVISSGAKMSTNAMIFAREFGFIGDELATIGSFTLNAEDRLFIWRHVNTVFPNAREEERHVIAEMICITYAAQGLKSKGWKHAARIFVQSFGTPANGPSSTGKFPQEVIANQSEWDVFNSRMLTLHADNQDFTISPEILTEKDASLLADIKNNFPSKYLVNQAQHPTPVNDGWGGY